VPPPAVKPALQPAIQTGPRAYERWRSSRLENVTEALEQICILDLVGPVAGRRILDLGCGDGLLAWMLADRGARAVGLDVDRAMLDVASARSLRSQRKRPRFVEGRIEQLPFRDGSFDVVVIVTVLCLVADRAGAVREAALVLRPGGRLVVGDLGRWSAWAALRRAKAWLGSKLWQSAHFATAFGLSRLVERGGLTVEAVHGSVYYPPIGVLARPLARCDRRLGTITTVGAAFIALAARKPTTGVSTRTGSS
jgi:ubiquinone/menaquinone biosynthesis C-methylase UbiE